MKICKKCGLSKLVEEFNQDSSKVDGRRRHCRTCDALYTASYREKNRESLNAKTKAWKVANPEKAKLVNRETKLKIQYGLTTADVNSLLKDQKGACAICRELFTETPNVDHCHKSLRVRGLLCQTCNLLLGMSGDSIECLQRGIEYLQKFS